MDNFFIIPIMEYDAAWCLRGFNHNYYAKEYCNGVLKIPLAYIEESDISSFGLEIKLKNAEQIAKEEWYIRLTVLANNIKKNENNMLKVRMRIKDVFDR